MLQSSPEVTMRFFRVCSLTSSALAIAVLGGCSGGTTDSSRNTGGNGSGGGGDLPSTGTDKEGLCEITDDGWEVAPMRRLSNVEYDNAVADLLGDDLRLPEALLPGDESVSGYASNGVVTVGVSEAEKFSAAAKSVAERFVPRQADLLKCASGQTNEACAIDFIKRTGRLAFRRTLEADETELLNQIYLNKAKTTDHPQAIRLVVEAILQMPQFLYRPVVGLQNEQSSANKLTGEEIASRLSFFLWSSIPDNDLLAAAEAGDLDATDGLTAQVRRMMDDPRFDRSLEAFSLQWLGVEARPAKDDLKFPGFTEDFWSSAKTSISRFFHHAVKETDGNMKSLFTAPIAFADQKLASTYGVSAKSSTFDSFKTDAKERGGIFTQAAVMATLSGTTETSPVKRGLFVRAKLLCQTPPPPPPMGVAPLPAETTDKTLRQRLEEHRANPACAACHAFFDPLGLAFEHFDAVGAYRAQEHGIAIDATGELSDSDVDGNFTDAMELLGQLEQSAIASECLSNQLFRFAIGRLESEADACVLKRMSHDLTKDGYSLQDAFVKLATSDAFRFVGRI